MNPAPRRTEASGQIDETIRAYTGADVFGVNAVEAVNLCKNWREAAS